MINWNLFISMYHSLFLKIPRPLGEVLGDVHLLPYKEQLYKQAQTARAKFGNKI